MPKKIKTYCGISTSAASSVIMLGLIAESVSRSLRRWRFLSAASACLVSELVVIAGASGTGVSAGADVDHLYEE